MKQHEIENQPALPYSSITELPLRNFIDVLCDGNLSQMAKRGFPTKEELSNAWSKIILEYSDAMESGEQKLWLNLMKDCAILELTLVQINGLVEILEVCYHEPFADMLNKLLHTTYKFDPNNLEEYHRLLKACISRSKSFKIDLDLKRIYMQALEKKAENEREPYTREYFHNLLIILSDHAKFHLDTSITVYEFAERIKRWNAHCEQVRKHLKP